MARASLAASLCLFALAAAAHARPLRGNPAERLTHLAIEDYRYDHARRCRKRPSRGARALVRWLERNVRGESWGIVRCSKLSRSNYSLHSEGRAVDWHLDARSARDRRSARRLIKTLLATDRAGNAHALARRMGIQEIIWNCRSWWSGAERPERYSQCYNRRGRRRKGVSPTLAHRDHIHLGLNLAGARKRTSFWRR